MKPRSLSDQSTIYHYTLTKKIPVRGEFLIAYIGLFVIFMMFIVFSAGWSHFLSLLMSFVFIQFIHTVIVYVYFHYRNQNHIKSWRFQWNFPWVGFLASLPISIHRFKVIHWHILLIGLAIILLLFPWIHAAFIVELLFVHCWILLPRFIVVALSMKVDKAELIMLNAKQISYYTT